MIGLRLFVVPIGVMVFLSSAATAQNSTESLFFTPNQLTSIMRANQGFIAPQEAYSEDNQSVSPIDSGPQIIGLAGIVYQAPGDWTIWLNNERVTPKTIPARVMGLSVKSDRVHIKWMDIARQRIVNITLRPHQRYVLATDTIIAGTERPAAQE